MCFEFRKVNHHVRFHYFSRNQILVPACTVGASQQVRVVHWDAELARVRTKGLEKAVLFKIEQHEMLEFAHILGPLMANRVSLENWATKISDGELQPSPPKLID